MTRFAIPTLAVITLSTISYLCADTIIFTDNLGTVSFQQLPDSPGGSLDDTIFQSRCQETEVPEYCIVDLASNGLTPAVIGGYVGIGPSRSLDPPDLLGD